MRFILFVLVCISILSTSCRSGPDPVATDINDNGPTPTSPGPTKRSPTPTVIPPTPTPPSPTPTDETPYRVAQHVETDDWQWFQIDTHTHSVFSADAVSDIGILSLAQELGYDALFLTDHTGGSTFQINGLHANRMVFEDTYTRWSPALYGTPITTINQLSQEPVYRGRSSLHLRNEANETYSETSVWTRRGPNLLSGSAMLEVSIYPTQIDPNSGIYVSVSIGGDPTVEENPDGYTTQEGIISPGKTNVFVWQLGSPRPSAWDKDETNGRVLTYSLGEYELNRWNHYLINVSHALQDLPLEERPLEYNAFTHLKIAAAATNGTAEAFVDAYSLTASKPLPPAEEFVYRTSVVDDFNSEHFKIFPAYEMGQRKHTQRFNFGITSSDQYRAYDLGVRGIEETHQSRYPAMLNHPGITIDADEAVDRQAYGAELLEIRREEWLETWDAILRQKRIVLGSWSTDSHQRFVDTRPATYIYAQRLDLDPLIRSLFEGRFYNARSNLDGHLILGTDAEPQQPYPSRYPVYVSDRQDKVEVHLEVSGGLHSNYVIHWVRNGKFLDVENPAREFHHSRRMLTLDGDWTYIRAELYSGRGTLIGLTQPIFFTDVAGLPQEIQYHVQGVTTPSGHHYTAIDTQGITDSQWNASQQTLELQLQNPINSIVEVHLDSPKPPVRIEVNGEISPSRTDISVLSKPELNKEWFYDNVGQRLYLYVHQETPITELSIQFKP